ncbi:unnamed protein product [Bursaphelenchus xylophilus]|uniref:(pine wood nematode) hypothetical protein n=1 Tax=Bursaphelenchus xylophilus TaxID=6326 RepID=A0A1I7S5P4_BURXY|nr:unnamed protein product [Bursaphelenchus xylophilus]CAG9124931.1 unnamed protein product [Bursaphelenchus xylophilus]
MFALAICLLCVRFAYSFDHSGEVSSTMSPLLIHSMLEQNKFIRYVQTLPVANNTKNTMLMVARIRKRLPEDTHYNTTTFLSYIAHYDKTYSNEYEAAEKYKNIRYSMDEIEVQQKQNPLAVFGLTQFSDMTTSEFIAVHTCGRQTKPMSHFASRLEEKPLTIASPRVRADDSFDWRSKGKVTPVRNQGKCGCCYAFAAVAAVESQHAIKTGKQLHLSEQEAISCTYKVAKYGNNNGCNGGQSDGVFKYVIDNGLTTESSFKTVSPTTLQIPKCKKGRAAARISRQSRLPSGDEKSMQSMVKSVGPIVTYIDADPLKNYRSGIVSSRGGQVNHAVLTVGYGRDHWIIKNSWGTSWGEKGYFRAAKGKNTLNLAEYNFAAYK